MFATRELSATLRARRAGVEAFKASEPPEQARP